jgi:hypothetical protein
VVISIKGIDELGELVILSANSDELSYSIWTITSVQPVDAPVVPDSVPDAPVVSDSLDAPVVLDASVSDDEACACAVNCNSIKQSVNCPLCGGALVVELAISAIASVAAPAPAEVAATPDSVVDAAPAVISDLPVAPVSVVDTAPVVVALDPVVAAVSMPDPSIIVPVVLPVPDPTIAPVVAAPAIVVVAPVVDPTVVVAPVAPAAS